MFGLFKNIDFEKDRKLNLNSNLFGMEAQSSQTSKYSKSVVSRNK